MGLWFAILVAKEAKDIFLDACFLILILKDIAL